MFVLADLLGFNGIFTHHLVKLSVTYWQISAQLSSEIRVFFFSQQKIIHEIRPRSGSFLHLQFIFQSQIITVISYTQSQRLLRHTWLLLFSLSLVADPGICSQPGSVFKASKVGRRPQQAQSQGYFPLKLKKNSLFATFLKKRLRPRNETKAMGENLYFLFFYRT